MLFDFCFLAGQEWNKVLNGEVRKEVEEFLQQDAHLDEYAGQVLHYNSYVEQASLVPTSALLHVFRSVLFTHFFKRTKCSGAVQSESRTSHKPQKKAEKNMLELSYIIFACYLVFVSIISFH